MIANPKASIADFIEGAIYHAARESGAPLTDRTRRLADLYATAGGDEQTTISNPYGGFLAPYELSTELLQRTFDFSRVASRCRKVTVGGGGLNLPAYRESSRADGSRLGGVASFWTAETQAPTKSRGEFQQLNMVTGSLKVLIPVSEELARRVPNLGELLLSAAAEEIAVRTDDAVINGVVGGPAGILPDAATIPVTKETNQTAGTIIPENVVKMIRRLWTYSDSRATFFASRSAQLEVLTNCASLIRFADPNDPGPARMSLAGIPLLPIEQCPAVGTKGDLILADCSQYALGDRGETKSAESIYVRFENHERMLKFWYECDGRSIWKDPVSPLRDGTDTLSPFIVLEDRS